MGKNPNYLGSWDLEELPNREAVLTIEKIVDEEVVTNGKTENCTVSHWTDKNFKPMILNPTNKKTLAKLYKTKESENLKGKSVVIGISQIKAFGAIHDALRIRPRIPQAQNAASPKCVSCGKNVEAYGNMSAETVAAYNQKKYGKCLCSRCATALKQGGELK